MNVLMFPPPKWGKRVVRILRFPIMLSGSTGQMSQASIKVLALNWEQYFNATSAFSGESKSLSATPATTSPSVKRF